MKIKKLKKVMKELLREAVDTNTFYEKEIANLTESISVLQKAMQEEKKQKELWIERCKQLRKKKNTEYTSDYGEVDGNKGSVIYRTEWREKDGKWVPVAQEHEYER